MEIEPFDLTPIFDKIQEDFGYVAIDDNRLEKVLSDETHAVLTRLLNHYVISEKPENLIGEIKRIRDEISSNANLYPLAKIYSPFQYVKNYYPEELDEFKSILDKLLEKVQDLNLVRYAKFLLNEPFIVISIKVREIKRKNVEKGSIIKHELTVEDLDPVPNFSFRLVDPLDNFMWKVLTDKQGNAEFKILPIVYSKYGKRYYQLFTSKKIIKFEPRMHQQVELILADDLQVNLIKKSSESSWFSNCHICKKELMKQSSLKCENCGREMCSECMDLVGILKKKKICKICKNK